MRLSCRNSIFALAIISGCRGTAEPQPARGLYSLENVDGTPLPALISAGAGDTTYIVSSLLSLNAGGEALTTNTIKHIYLQYPAEVTSHSVHQSYRISGHNIELGNFTQCPGTVMCAGNLHGVITATSLAIAEFYNPYPTNPILYNYQHIQADRH